MFEIEMLEKEIEKLAKEISIDGKHVQRFFDGTYRGISLTKRTKTKRIILLTQLSNDGNNPIINPIIKAVKEDNHEVIFKMERLVKLIRAYRVLKKAEEVRQKVREGLYDREGSRGY